MMPTGVPSKEARKTREAKPQHAPVDRVDIQPEARFGERRGARDVDAKCGIA